MVYLALQEIFGSTEIFHGRTRELDVLKGIYGEICRGDAVAAETTTPFGRNQTQKTEESSLSVPEVPAPDDTTTQTTSSCSPGSGRRSRSACGRTVCGESVRSARDHHHHHHRRTVAFISGVSGSGKSSLVRRFVEDLRKESQKIQTDDETTAATMMIRAPLFLTGKFNDTAGADPYSAFVEAFSELTTLLLGNDECPQTNEYYVDDLVRIRRDIEARLGPEEL